MKSPCLVSLFATFAFANLAIVPATAQSNRAARPNQVSSPSASQSGGSGSHAMGTDNSLFLPTVSYDAGEAGSQTLAVADLNGDGKLDVVVANYSGTPDGSMGVLLGNGDGTFKPVVSYDPGPACNPLSIVVGDLNGDGHPDVVTATNGCVAVWLGNGDGTFRQAVTYDSGGTGFAGGPDIFNPVLIADFNHDGKPDVAVLNPTSRQYGDGSIGILLGNGDGTFQPVKTYDSGGFGATSFAIADLNGDGNLDLVVPNCGAAGTTDCGLKDSSLAVLLGKGDGTFQPAKLYDRGGSGGFASPVAVADINGDGKLDIIVGNSCTVVKHGQCEYGADGTIGVLLGKGDGTFKSPVTYDSGEGGVGWMSVVDVDGDGKLDVVVSSAGVNVLRGKGDGTFWLADRYAPGVTGVEVVADVNGDGILDLIGAEVTGNTLMALLGNGSGFSGPTLFPSGGSSIFSDFVVGDLNGDGRLDVLTASWGPESGTNNTLGVLLNNPSFVNNGTKTTVASSQNPASANQSITYTATVTSLNGGPVTGTVLFQQAAKIVGQVNLTGNQASISLQYPKLGTYPLQATYSGDANNGASTSLTFDEYVKVLPVPTKTTLATSRSPSHIGQPVTFTATVTSDFGTIPNGELVTFSNGKTVLGTGSTNNGVATLTTSFSKARTYTIKAAYAGDDAFKTSSGMVKQVVSQ